jgi:hypothetical protein
MRQVRVGLVVALMVFAGSSWAQTGPPPSPAQSSGTAPPPRTAPSPAMKQARSKMRAACAADIQKFCADAERGKSARACLQSHRAELSPECASARAELRAERRQEKAEAK